MQFAPLPAAAATGAAPPPAEAAARKKIADAAQSFEAHVLSTLMQSMFQGVDAGDFGGGYGEQQFKSLLVDAMARQTARSGGIGVADQVNREMLKLQGLSEEPSHVA